MAGADSGFSDAPKPVNATFQRVFGTPVVLDGRYVLAFTIYYGLATAWGILATRNGLAAIEDTAGALASAIFAACVTVVSLILACLTLTRAQKTEKWFTLAWIAVVAPVPASVIYQFIAEGDLTRAAGSASTLMYFVFPFSRFVYLVFKTRKARK